MNRDLLLALLCVVLVAVATLSAMPSFWSRQSNGQGLLMTFGDPLAKGVFLGAGLVHMLPHAARGYASVGLDYPWTYVICGGVALALAMLDQPEPDEKGAVARPLIAAGMLAVHSLLAGAALGATQGGLALATLFLALLAHKGAASFSLSRLLAGSGLSRPQGIVVQSIFVLALPIGVAIGEIVLQQRAWPLAAPTMMALGAGTFVYFGTIHDHNGAGLRGGRRLAPLLGFVVMALIAAIG